MQTIYIRNRRFTKISLRELFQYRELAWALAIRDLKIRYAQTFVGAAWAFIQPVVTLAILYVVFDRFAGVETNGLPYLLYAAAGYAGWTYFSYVFTNSGNSLIVAQQMIRKIYFPRLLIPFSRALTGLIDLAVIFAIIVVLMMVYGQAPGQMVYMTPLFILLNITGALGMGFWISALSIRYRDFQYVTPVLIQMGLYLSPVAFPSGYAIKHLPGWAAKLYCLNPTVGVIDGLRWSLFGSETFTSYSMISICSALFIFASGILFFQLMENKVADVI